jgi:hypothetical protein
MRKIRPRGVIPGLWGRFLDLCMVTFLVGLGLRFAGTILAQCMMLYAHHKHTGRLLCSSHAHRGKRGSLTLVHERLQNPHQPS